jgi:hypothetical protein
LIKLERETFDELPEPRTEFYYETMILKAWMEKGKQRIQCDGFTTRHMWIVRLRKI